ncbi:5'-nucleotidase [Yeosuana aromativorans]|uniref:5'-nucleotidase n=2 Tax=Yeosuana aromativorans TaxID=288019 RepID=A0A8J3BN28_9FLAO|nr:5'-nucleotidase [Yeosuana aromativorans]
MPEQTSQSTQPSSNSIAKREYSVQSVLWVQHAAEYKALCYQAFNVAKFQLDKVLSEGNNTGKPLAIVTDIDETIFDNSPYEAKLITDNVEYSHDTWVEWEQLQKAKPIPGSLEFLNYAESKGVQVFYISNISKIQEDLTMEHLKNLGFPNVDKQHILFRDKTSGKEERRQTVSKDNTIVMLLGDTLSDFSNVFDNKSTAERNSAAQSLKEKFGKEFIVLPGPTYGDWEMKGIYEGNYKWTEVQKDSIRKAKLITY